MNLYQCQKKAEDEGFDRATFIAHFPKGPTKCKWLDAYFGFFQSEGMPDNQFLMVKQIDQMFPNLICSDFEANPPLQKMA